jgi:hypothetical protein
VDRVISSVCPSVGASVGASVGVSVRPSVTGKLGRYTKADIARYARLNIGNKGHFENCFGNMQDI